VYLKVSVSYKQDDQEVICIINSIKLLLFKRCFVVLNKIKYKPGTVAYGCYPSYLGDGDREDHGLRPIQVKANKTLGVIASVCHPRYIGSINRRIAI
jgi:hypothetical protein